MVTEGTLRLDLEGQRVGQVNGLSVLDLGYYAFGRPVRITATAGPGRPIPLTATLTFEQSYDHIDGDSAASAELYALLSELAGVPLRQDVAVTGSVNQRGELQAIGGVNDKIEGFYRACTLRGLTGRQGVLIPEANVRHLMLSPWVVESARAGRFHVWSARHVDHGIELLTGIPARTPDEWHGFPAGTVHARVEKRLERWRLLADSEAKDDRR